METCNDYRTKCVMLLRLLEQKNKELNALKKVCVGPSKAETPILAAMDIFHKTLVTAERNAMIHHKPSVTQKSEGYVEINYRVFWDITMDTMLSTVMPEDIVSYKETLRDLQLVCSGSLERGGIPSRIEGRTMRVIRVPERIYFLLIGREAQAS